MFNQKLKDEIEELKIKLAEAQEEIEDLINSKPLIYTILTKKNSIEVIADRYREESYLNSKARFFLKNRTVATFDNVKSFTTREIDATYHNDQR